jgi:sugar/nucleoside kinase (ribokinase family)
VKHIDVLSIGETLIDLISDTKQISLVDAPRYVMYPGGQATNVALNIARMGGKTAIVARVGDDSFGLYLRHHLATAGVETAFLHVTPHTPTTLAVVTRHTTTPDFTIYRGDSFWAGLLLAELDGYTTAEVIRVAQAVAEIKVQQVGPLSQEIDRAALYARLGLPKPGERMRGSL